MHLSAHFSQVQLPVVFHTHSDACVAGTASTLKKDRVPLAAFSAKLYSSGSDMASPTPARQVHTVIQRARMINEEQRERAYVTLSILKRQHEVPHHDGFFLGQRDDVAAVITTPLRRHGKVGVLPVKFIPGWRICDGGGHCARSVVNHEML